MDREEILKMSRKENEGKRDERERLELDAASRVGMFTGLFVCMALVGYVLKEIVIILIFVTLRVLK